MPEPPGNPAEEADGPRRPYVSVVMPALDERETIEDAIAVSLRAFERFSLPGEIVVIDDGSTDGTGELADRAAERNPGQIRVIHHPHPFGIGASFWEGVDACRGEIIVMLPGDNENDPFEILQYYRLLEQVDLVIPFVYNKRARSLFRNGLSFLYRFIINTTFLVYFNYTNGTVLYRASVLRRVKHRSVGFFFQTDILIRLVKSGYLFAEVPYRLNARMQGVSKAVSFPSLIQVCRGYLRLVNEIYRNQSSTIPEVRGLDEDSSTARRNREALLHETEGHPSGQPS